MTTQQTFTLSPGQRLTLTLADGRTGEIAVQRTGRGAVRLSLEFPRDVPIHRPDRLVRKEAAR